MGYFILRIKETSDETRCRRTSYVMYIIGKCGLFDFENKVKRRLHL